MGEENKNLCNSDHDTIVTLVAVVGNIKEGQDKFHLEMKESQAQIRNEMANSFKELKDNYSTRIEEQSLKTKAHEVRLNALESTSTKQTVTLALSGTALAIILGLLVKHMFN